MKKYREIALAASMFALAFANEKPTEPETDACPDCGGQGIDTSWASRPTAKCETCDGSGRIPLVGA